MFTRTTDHSNSFGLRKVLSAAVLSILVLTRPVFAQSGDTCSSIQWQMDQLRAEFARNLAERPLSTGCAILLGDTVVSVIMEDTGSRIPPELRTFGTAACVIYCVGSEQAECGTAATTIASIAARYAILKSAQRECRR